MRCLLAVTGLSPSLSGMCAGKWAAVTPVTAVTNSATAPACWRPLSLGRQRGNLLTSVRSSSYRLPGMAAEPQDGDGEDWAALAMDRRPQ